MNVYFQIVVAGLMLLGLKAKAQTRVDNFNLYQYKEQVLLSFEITAGASCSGYEIQHSSDSVYFVSAYNYIGVCGSTNKNQPYSYTHTTAVVNATNYYRVLIPPSDYSSIKSIEIKSKVGFVVTNNPVKKYLNIFINTGNFLEVYNGQGHKVADFKASEDGLVDADVSDLSQGIYYFIVYDNQGQIFKNKFLKVDD